MLLQQAEVIDPRSIDQRVDAAKALSGGDHGFTAAAFADVRSHQRDFAGMGLGQRLPGFGLAANQQQVGTVAQQFGDQCLANPTTGPGDHGAAFRNIHR